MQKKFVFKIVRNSLFFLTLVLLTFWLIFKDQNMIELFEIIGSVNGICIMLGILCMIVYFLIEAYNKKYLLHCLGQDVSIFKTLKFTLICYFFNGVTPASSGGQPMEIYYMSKENISVSNSTIVLFVQACGFLVSTICIGVVCELINPNILPENLIWLFLLGVFVNCIPLSLVLICIFSPKLMIKIVNIIIKILKKIGFKKIETKVDRINQEIEKYNESSLYIKAHIDIFIKSVFRVFIQTSFYYLVPFFVFKAFGLNGYNVFQIFAMQAILFCTTSGLPLPGAIGISEAMYLNIFTPVFGKKFIGSALILNRGINFYWFIVVGLIIIIVSYIPIRSRKKTNLYNKDIDI